MIPKLSEELQIALRQSRGTGPVCAIDPATNETYVLVRADVYEQMKGLVDESDPREACPFVDKILSEDDAQDPALDNYQDSSGSRTACQAERMS
jgi:hypothetical protein